jgi:hypothetical protein
MSDQFNTQPQPRTFAPSKEDVLQNLQYFFGAPVSPEKLKDYSEHHAVTHHFPDAYIGQNTKIRDTLNNLILNSPQTWQTSVGLPYFQIQGTVVEWDEVRFDVRLMQRVPYEGTSRMQTSLRRRQRDRVVRRGLAMMIESDFYATDAGRQHFADQLKSIRYCVQETCNFDVLYAYLTCGNYDFNYDRSKNLRPKRNIRTAMNHEVMMYAIAQKEQLGFDKAVEECKYRMSRYGVSPNMLVMPPQMLLYMALAPEAKLTYAQGGPAAEARFEAGVAGFEARAFRGCGIMTSEPFEVSDDQDSVQMLTRNSQIGEFYVLQPPQVDPTDGLPTNKGKAKFTCDALIYDEESDRHVRVTWGQAVKACCIGGTGGVNGNTKMSAGTAKVEKNDMDLKAWKDAADKWTAWNNGTGDKPYAELDPDIRIVIARPFIEHLMHSVVMAVSGRDTGATLFGPADMQLSANTQVKTIEGHYTGHFKAVVTKPQNVLVMRDVACAGYVAGCNTLFFAENSDGDFSMPTAGTNMMERLAFSNDVGAKYASMLAFPCTAKQMQSGHLDTVMSVTTRLLPWEVTSATAATTTPSRVASWSSRSTSARSGCARCTLART